MWHCSGVPMDATVWSICHFRIRVCNHHWFRNLNLMKKWENKTRFFWTRMRDEEQETQDMPFFLEPNWLSIVVWAYTGIFTLNVWFQITDRFGFPTKNIGVFQFFWVQKLAVVQWQRVFTKAWHCTRITCVKLVCAYTFWHFYICIDNHCFVLFFVCTSFLRRHLIDMVFEHKRTKLTTYKQFIS